MVNIIINSRSYPRTRTRTPTSPLLATPTTHLYHQDLMEPFHYINQVPGKDVRGKLIDAFQVDTG